jgi:hypothetical protein
VNDEQGYEPPEMSPEERRRSRWAVQPGSVSDSLSFRRPDGMDDAARSERRPPSEIIREVRGERVTGEEPTRVSERRPQIPPEDPTTHAEDSDRDAAPMRATEPRSSRAELYDESTRVTPDLGQNRDLQAATGGSSSSLVMAGFGGVILVAIGGLIGAILDYLFSDRIGVVTTVGLTLGAVVAALVTRKRDLVSVIVAPPIVYAVIATIVLLISSRAIGVTSIADVAIRGFPAMALATGLAALISGIRLVKSRVGERR